jgi:DNA-binding transcriptional LysR family regulator
LWFAEMTNVPTDLLRTLVTVVDLRSFTRAAQALGVTQPAVSAQIKRLQALLGGELFDKSAPGVTLTPKGDLVVTGARQLLAINDQILKAVRPQAEPPTLRLGIAAALGPDIPIAPIAPLGRISGGWRCEIRRDGSDDMLTELAHDEIDLVVALTESHPEHAARHRWTEPLAWLRSPSVGCDPSEPVPLIACGPGGDLTRLAIAALSREGRAWEIVCKVPDESSVMPAIVAGLGVAPAPRRLMPADVSIASEAPLPRLPDLHCGVYLRDGTGAEVLRGVADAIATALRPEATASRVSRQVLAPVALRMGSLPS